MKRIFTFFLSLLIIPVCFAQNTWEVGVFGGGPGNPSPSYSPQFLTIQVGDTVRWTNTQGQHNVDGTTSTFPSNPEGFTSGDPALATWTFEFVFTIPGTYDYECSAFDHADTQFGTITVTDITNSIEENTTIDFYIYPNPVEDEINVLTQDNVERIEILDVSRNVSLVEIPAQFNNSYGIDISELNSGIYFIIVYSEGYKGVKRFIKR